MTHGDNPKSTDNRKTLMLQDSGDLLLRKHEPRKRFNSINKTFSPQRKAPGFKTYECRATRPSFVKPRRRRLLGQRVCVTDDLLVVVKFVPSLIPSFGTDA